MFSSFVPSSPFIPLTTAGLCPAGGAPEPTKGLDSAARRSRCGTQSKALKRPEQGPAVSVLSRGAGPAVRPDRPAPPPAPVDVVCAAFHIYPHAFYLKDSRSSALTQLRMQLCDLALRTSPAAWHLARPRPAWAWEGHPTAAGPWRRQRPPAGQGPRTFGLYFCISTT